MKDEIDRQIAIFWKRTILNCIRRFPPASLLRDRYDDKMLDGADSIIDRVVRESGLYEKYMNVDISSPGSAGSRIWMFWYTGFDTAPPIVRKCADLACQLDGAQVVFIDKDNLEEYFEFQGDVRNAYEEGRLKIQLLSDLIRWQLLSRKGGFWFDATLFATSKDFLGRYGQLQYFSVRQSRNDVLSKQKWNEFFTKGRWATYCNGSAPGNPLFSFIYDTFVSYFDYHDRPFNYFQSDYIWLYAYNHFDWARTMVDSLEPTCECTYFIGHNLKKSFSRIGWDDTMKSNSIQKLNWRVEKPRKDKTYYDFFIDSFGY